MPNISVFNTLSRNTPGNSPPDTYRGSMLVAFQNVFLTKEPKAYSDESEAPRYCSNCSIVIRIFLGFVPSSSPTTPASQS